MIVTNARDGDRRSPFETPKLNQVQVDCLDALGRGDEARELLWQEFCQTLNPGSLREHIKRLPDFEDVEAEDRARTLAMAHPDMMTALAFFLKWPDLRSAAALIESRHAELDGNAYYHLKPTADALDVDYPLAAS